MHHNKVDGDAQPAADRRSKRARTPSSRMLNATSADVLSADAQPSAKKPALSSTRAVETPATSRKQAPPTSGEAPAAAAQSPEQQKRIADYKAYLETMPPVRERTLDQVKQLKKLNNAQAPRKGEEGYEGSSVQAAHARRPRVGDKAYEGSSVQAGQARRPRVGDKAYEGSSVQAGQARRPRVGDKAYEGSSVQARNARRPRARVPGYAKTARGLSAARYNAGLSHAMLERDAEARARRGEDFDPARLVDEVEKAANSVMPFIEESLANGYGINILTASEHRVRTTIADTQKSIRSLAAEGVLPQQIRIVGLPEGGQANDESKRWACTDSSPSHVDGETGQAQTYAQFEDTYEVFALSKHRHHEYTRLLEGELQRRVCSTKYKAHWPQYMNRHPGNLDGPRSPGNTYVLIARTIRPLEELITEGVLARRTPVWSGLASGASIQTLCDKLRNGAKDGTHARPKAKALVERVSSEYLPESEQLLEECRLVVISATGDVHKKRKNADSNCYHTVQLWADGTVSNVCGRIETEGKGGRLYVHGIDLSRDAAKKEFDKVIDAKMKMGYRKEARGVRE